MLLADDEDDSLVDDFINGNIDLNESFGNQPNSTAGGSSTVLKASFNMTKTIVGAGVFGLPNTFQKAGFMTVTVLIIAMAFFVNWTLQVLLSAGLKAGVYTYHELMQK